MSESANSQAVPPLAVHKPLLEKAQSLLQSLPEGSGPTWVGSVLADAVLCTWLPA